MKKLITCILAIIMAIVLVVPAQSVSAEESAHTHSYDFSTDGNTLTATCTCGDKKTYKLITDEKTYDGTIYNIGYIENWDELKVLLGAEGYELEYKKVESDWDTGSFPSCQDAGYYTVRARITDYYSRTYILVSAFSINKRNVTIVAGSDSKEYDGTPLTNNTFSVKEYSTGDSDDGFAEGEGIVSVTMTTESSITNPGTVKNVINPALICTKSGTDPNNYNITYKDGILEVTKLTCNQVPEGLVAVQPSHYGLSDGAVSGTAIDMEYSRDAGFSTATDCTADQTTGLSAGTFYVRFKETELMTAGNYVAVVIPDGDGYNDNQNSGNNSQWSNSESGSSSESFETGQTTDVTEDSNDTDNVLAALDCSKAAEQALTEMSKTEEGAKSIKLLEQILAVNQTEGDTQGSDKQNADSSARLTVEVSETSPDKADKGSLKNNVFKTPEGEIIKNSFVERTKNGKKYFADENGKRVTDAIVTDGEKLYYCNKSGVVQVDKAVTLVNNATVLTDKTGAIITKSDAKVSVGGKSYITGEGGVVVQDSKVTISVSKKKNGKTETVEKTYITNEKGVVMTGLVSYNGKTYVTSKTGIVKKNKITKINGKKVYTNKNGVVVVNKTVKIDGVKYKADENGYLKKIK